MAHCCPGLIVRITDEIQISNDFIIDNKHVYLFRCGEDQDHVEIAEIVLAQAKKKKTNSDLEKAMWKKLLADYLGEKTGEFIKKFFVTLETKSYLQSNPGPSTPRIESTTASEHEVGHFTDFDEKVKLNFLLQ